jgi:PilZ domain-containing protein
VTTRQAQRFKVQLPVDFTGSRDGTGTLHDLSILGCRIVSRTPLDVGQSLKLTLYQGEGAKPIVVETAEVRWRNAWHIGVMFQTPAPEEQIRSLLSRRASSQA